ncbi:MAG: hypothetical protein KJZ84_02305 [Bryobacteraceae bacterium]|nr:hypothetical protein [Bryobacteraceae bacterium]
MPRPTPRFQALALPLLFAATAALQLWPVWAFPYLPTQDGPAHLYNASIINAHRDWPILREYFEFQVSAAGNLMSHAVLSALLPLTGPLLAQKILASLILALYPLSAWMLLRTLGGQAGFALWFLLLAKNTLFYMGFWNFALGAALLFLAIAVARGTAERPRPLALAGIAAVSGLLYFCHSIPWALGLAGVLLVWLEKHALAAGRDFFRALPGFALRMIPAAAALAWPAALLVYYLATSERLEAEPSRERLSGRFWHFYSGHFLGQFGASVMTVRTLTMAFAVTAAGLAVFLRARGREWLRPGDSLLALSAVFGIALLFVPESLGSAGFLLFRFALLMAMAFFVWLGCQPWPGWARAASGTVCLAAAFLAAVSAAEATRALQPALTEIASIGAHVPAGSVVMPAQANRAMTAGFDPLIHATGYWAPKPYVNLRNYEAFTPHFPVSFRREYRPSGALGEVPELQAAPARFSIATYERLRRGRVDTVVVYGVRPESILADLPQSAWDPGGEFVLDAVSRPRGLAYLYRRSKLLAPGPHPSN